MSLLFNLLFVLLLNLAASEESSLAGYGIKNFRLARCASTDGDPITLENINVRIEDKSTVVVTGGFSTTVDLASPIRVKGEGQRKFGPSWLPLGIKIIDDACEFGQSGDEPCPAEFGDFPCRCPVAQGTYNIPDGIVKIKVPIMLHGTYKGKVDVSADGKRLACYEAQLDIVKV